MHKNINFRFTKFKSLQSSDEKSIKNFNSLFDYNMDCSTTTAASSSTRSDYNSLSVSESDSESETTNTADLATAFASQRFFFSSPGLSNSIVESTSASSSLASKTSSSSPESDTIAVSKYSMDPFIDFRLSMQEMVEARELVDVNSNWDYLHQLLMRYLSLNPKSTHKFIVGAFSDLLISMMAPPAAKSCLNK